MVMTRLCNINKQFSELFISIHTIHKTASEDSQKCVMFRRSMGVSLSRARECVVRIRVGVSLALFLGQPHNPDLPAAGAHGFHVT